MFTAYKALCIKRRYIEPEVWSIDEMHLLNWHKVNMALRWKYLKARSMQIENMQHSVYLKDCFFFSNISRVFKILLFEVKSICWPVWLVDRSVCHNSLKGREVILSCSYRSTCFAFGWLWDTRENARFSEKIMNKRLSSLHNMDAYHATKPYACTIVLQTRTYTCV